jgi:D-3-phosphoglycerate dehydrogenase
MKMKILANDGLAPEGLDHLAKDGFDIDTQKRDPDQLLREIAGFDALIVRSATKVTREVIEAGASGSGKLKIVGRAGIGTDNIDLDAAREYGVIVKFAPQGNVNAAAEHTIGLMFGIARNVPMAHHALKEGTWYKKAFVGSELAGKVMGIIGCGRIGQAVAEKGWGLGMHPIGYDLYQVIDTKIEYRDTVEEVLKEADFVTLHTGGDKVVVGEDELRLMKRSAFLINASRGKNVSEDALYAALKENRIAGAALDCYWSEPKKEGEPFESKLRELDNIVLSSHLGASTHNAGRRTALEMAKVVSSYLHRGDFANSVNVGQTVEEEGQQVFTIFITHDDKPGMFGKFGTALGEMGVNIRENNSRRLLDAVQTVYIVHQKPTRDVARNLESIDGVRRVTY